MSWHGTLSMTNKLIDRMNRFVVSRLGWVVCKLTMEVAVYTIMRCLLSVFANAQSSLSSQRFSFTSYLVCLFMVSVASTVLFKRLFMNFIMYGTLFLITLFFLWSCCNWHGPKFIVWVQCRKLCSNYNKYVEEQRT